MSISGEPATTVAPKVGFPTIPATLKRRARRIRPAKECAHRPGLRRPVFRLRTEISEKAEKTRKTSPAPRTSSKSARPASAALRPRRKVAIFAVLSSLPLGIDERELVARGVGVVEVGGPEHDAAEREPHRHPREHRACLVREAEAGHLLTREPRATIETRAVP